MPQLTRRRFLKISAAGLGAAAAAGSVPPAPSARPAAPGEAGTVHRVPTFCDVCFWKCGAIATVRDGRLWKIEGNPEDPLSRGRLCPRGTGGVGAHYDTVPGSPGVMKDAEEALGEPICRICGREGRHHLMSPVVFVPHAGMLPGPEDLI